MANWDFIIKQKEKINVSKGKSKMKSNERKNWSKKTELLVKNTVVLKSSATAAGCHDVGSGVALSISRLHSNRMIENNSRVGTLLGVSTRSLERKNYKL